MMRLLELGNQYVKESDWKDLALIKFCLCSMGVLLGMRVAPRYKKMVACIAATVFVITYLPLMTKFFAIACRDK